MSLFLLPKEHRTSVASLLLSAVKLDCEAGHEVSGPSWHVAVTDVKPSLQDGGLYGPLFSALLLAISRLIRLSQGPTPGRGQAQPRAGKRAMGSQAKRLLAAEAVQLLGRLPAFYERLHVPDAGE